jgi:hypothetical protein
MTQDDYATPTRYLKLRHGIDQMRYFSKCILRRGILYVDLSRIFLFQFSAYQSALGTEQMHIHIIHIIRIIYTVYILITGVYVGILTNI